MLFFHLFIECITISFSSQTDAPHPPKKEGKKAYILTRGFKGFCYAHMVSWLWPGVKQQIIGRTGEKDAEDKLYLSKSWSWWPASCNLTLLLSNPVHFNMFWIYQRNPVDYIRTLRIQSLPRAHQVAAKPLTHESPGDTADSNHHNNYFCFILFCVLEVRFHCVARIGPKLLGSKDPPASASWVTGTSGMHHCICLKNR